MELRQVRNYDKQFNKSKNGLTMLFIGAAALKFNVRPSSVTKWGKGNAKDSSL